VGVGDDECADWGFSDDVAEGLRDNISIFRFSQHRYPETSDSSSPAHYTLSMTY